MTKGRQQMLSSDTAVMIQLFRKGYPVKKEN